MIITGPEIITERLKLSQLLHRDAPDFFAYRCDPEVCRYQSFEPHSLADAEDFFGRVQPNVFDTPGTWFQFAVRRVGMREEAHFLQSLWFKGEWADGMVFAVLEKEWRV